MVIDQYSILQNIDIIQLYWSLISTSTSPCANKHLQIRYILYMSEHVWIQRFVNWSYVCMCICLRKCTYMCIELHRYTPTFISPLPPSPSSPLWTPRVMVLPPCPLWCAVVVFHYIYIQICMNTCFCGCVYLNVDIPIHPRGCTYSAMYTTYRCLLI